MYKYSDTQTSQQQMSSLFFFTWFVIISHIEYTDSRCAVASTTDGYSIEQVFTVDIDNGGTVIDQITGFTNTFTSIALDRKTSTAYVIEVDGNGEVYK